MTAPADRSFAGSIPQTYEQHLVPLLFEPYAIDLVSRVALRRPTRVLELAAGTGVVTRHMSRTLSPSTRIVATDLNQAMLDVAAKVRTSRTVEWQQADAMRLPFEDGSFDLVVCQFGAMFFPDKPRAFAEAARVLRRGGAFVGNVWDRIEENEFAAVIANAISGAFSGDPPRFLSRVPHGYHDRAAIAQDLARGGFTRSPQLVTVPARSRAESAQVPAVGYCQGTPLRAEIEARAPGRLAEATGIAADAITRRFGTHSVEGRLQAIVFSVEK